MMSFILGLNRVRLGLVFCGLLLASQSAVAELVVFEHGRYLRVEGVAVEGDLMRLDLGSGATMTVPLISVSRVLEDELVGNVSVPQADKFEIPSISSEFEDGQKMPSGEFGEVIFSSAKRHNVNPVIVSALIRAESAYDPMAVSSKGARGLMQLMPATARRFGAQADELFDPEINIEAGVRYLASLIDLYSGDLTLALAAYNAGEGAVKQHRGVPPYEETRTYIRRIYGFLGLEVAPGALSGK